MPFQLRTLSSVHLCSGTPNCSTARVYKVSLLYMTVLAMSLEVSAGCKIVGLEIVDGARAVQEHPFSGPTAFMLGNEVCAASIDFSYA